MTKKDEFITKSIQDKVELRTGAKAHLKIDNEKIIKPSISAIEFIKEMEGCIKEGTSNIDPMKLKKMWEPTER